jgi:hypothetical protein
MQKMILLLCCFTITISCAQNRSERFILGLEVAKTALAETLSNRKSANVIDNVRSIIKDSSTAVAAAEPILFDLYGKENIIRQRPYEIYHINNHWVISGTLPEGMLGGTFLIITDDRNAAVLKIMHGK